MTASTILVTRTFECRWCPATRTGQARVEIHDAHAMLHACADCEAQGFTATRIRRTDADHYIPVDVSTTIRHRDGLVSFRA
jgi:transcription elongation factor Elf1